MTTLATCQTLLQRQLPEVRAIYAQHGLQTTALEKLTPLIEHFEIRVPLIGAFSCGKSSLLNALLEERLLATAITPETAVPAELRFAPERRMEGCLPDGRTLPLQDADLREGNLSALAPDGWVQAHLQAVGCLGQPAKRRPDRKLGGRFGAPTRRHGKQGGAD